MMSFRILLLPTPTLRGVLLLPTPAGESHGKVYHRIICNQLRRWSHNAYQRKLKTLQNGNRILYAKPLSSALRSHPWKICIFLLVRDMANGDSYVFKIFIHSIHACICIEHYLPLGRSPRLAHICFCFHFYYPIPSGQNSGRTASL